jgi:hypothetical protein
MRWLISIFALWFVVGSTGASADVRSCSGRINVGDVVIAKINGEGTCKNKAHANDCRAHAHRAIVKCAKELFLARDNVIPNSCKGGRGVETAVLQWNQIILIPQGNNLVDRVRWNMCCAGQAPNTKKSKVITVHVSGDKGCGKFKHGKNLFEEDHGITTIEIDCQKDRLEVCPPKRASPD